MSATVSGNPKPSITWHKNKIELENNLKTEIVKEDFTTKIVVNNLTREDTAEYMLHLKNSVGERLVLYILLHKWLQLFFQIYNR